MTNSKENDWLLNRVSNPTFSISDFKAVGLDATNTSLEDASVYKNIPQIRDNPAFQTDGKFDEAKFDSIYKYMAETYNQLADESYQEDILTQATFHRDNIFVDPEQRRKGPDIYLSKEANPLRQKRGIRRLNLLDAPTLSMDEVAQTQKVLANPVDVANGAKPIWHDSPNDSFWTDFWDTRVMAQWDEDGEHIDPISGEKVQHKKGDLKLNENGTYYYENLNGRDVYGRRVLSKLNTLTTDGSAINKYDFFDSDGLDKSLVGSIARNAVEIIPMLIPGISPWYMGTRMALETTKVLATLGKVFTGSDNKFLSSVEGFTKSLEPTTSEYGQNNTWSMENFVNLAGDVFRQLYEQRWIFKYAPAIFRGENMATESAQMKKLEEFQSKYMNLDSYLKAKSAIEKTGDLKYLEELKAVNILKAQSELENYMKSYNKIGEVLSKAYMTGITVQDAYGEAKEQGATDLEAALLTLGYAAGEYAIINSKLGEWILPELRMDKEQMRQVVKTLTEGSRKVIDNGSKVQKAEWAKKIFKIGKDIAQANYSVGKSGLKAIAANALGEGIEEVSEEVLYDFAKSVTNLGMWLAGSDTQPLQAWDNMLDRYGMSFVGGMLGGAMFDAVPNLRAARQLGQMNNQQAMQQLVYMARNGKMNDFLKLVNKMELGNKYLSATKMTEGIDGKKIWAQGTDTDNQDIAAKSEIRRIAKFVSDTLSAQGATISDDSFLDTQTLNDLRFAALKNSTVATSYLQDYNSICEKIVTLTNQLNSLGGTQERMENGGPTDKQVREGGDEASKAKRSELEAELKQALERKEAYMKGDLAPQFIYDALFEMSTAVSSAYMAPTLIQYAENKTGKKVTDIPKKELEEISKEYEGWKNSGFKDAVRVAASIHKSIAKTVAPLFQNHSLKYYENVDEELNNTLGALQAGLNSFTKNLNNQMDSEEFMGMMSEYNMDASLTTLTPLVASLGSESEVQTLSSILNTPVTEDYTEAIKKTQLSKFLNNFLLSHIDAIVKPIVKQGYINPEIKRTLTETLNSAYWYFNDQAEFYDDSEGWMNAAKMEEAKAQINSLKHSNIAELLDQFSLSTTDSDIKISKLLEDVTISLKDSMDNLSDFNLNNERLDQIKEALSIINIFKAQLLSARVDNADLSNLYGMNVTINELDSEANLAEIQSNVADAMMQDLESIELRLQTFQKIIATNNAQKLAEQTRTANNKNIIVYDRIKKFAMNIPDDWSGKVEFQGVLSSLSKLEEISASRKLSLNKEEKSQVELEMIKLDDAIYDFFKANEDKVKDPELLSKVINTDNFSLISPNEAILNSDSKYIDDNAMVWYIASRAAVRASDFYSEYRTIISDKIAPIPTQELATYLGYASILNGGVIDNFCNAVNTSLKKWAESFKNDDELQESTRYTDDKGNSYKVEHISKDFILDSSVSPRFSRVTFIEGIPGSGKTTGVFNNIIVLLKKYHPEVLKSVWIGHATEESAGNLKKDLNLDSAVALDKNKLMTKVSTEWKSFESYKKDANGHAVIDDSDVFLDDDNIVRSALKINEISEAPSLILIDEVSRYTTLDMDLINKFAQKYGIPVIVAGDFDQSRAVGTHTINYKGASLTNYVELSRNNFIRTPKLGVSMRANNNQVVQNLNLIRPILKNLRTANYSDDIPLHYYQDDSGLYGTKVYSNGNNRAIPCSMELIKKDIDLMISTMKPGEKVGFIYYDTDTEIYKLLSSATYKDKVDFKQGDTSQGLEGRYYIIDDSGSLGSEKYWSDLYTGISRALQGSIVIHSKADYGSAGTSNQMYSIQDISTSVNELSKDGIKSFSEERRTILNNLPIDGKPTVLSSREKDNTVPTVTVTPEVGLTSETVTTVTDDGTKEEVIITNNGLPTDEDIRSKTQASNEEPTPPPPPAVEVTNVSGKKSESILNLLMYTFPTFESGAVFDDKGNLVVTEENEKRLDSYYGLNKLSGIAKNKESFDKMIGNLRSIIFSTPDKAELTKKIKTLLRLGDNAYCTFAFKSSAAKFNNKDWGRFKKSASETLSYIFSDDAGSDKVKLKTLSIIIGEGDTDVLELPIAIFPNPLTLFKNDKFKLVRDEYNEITRRNPDMSSYQKFEELIKFIQANPSIEGGDALINFFKVYNFNSNGVFYIDDANWTLANGLKSQGPTMTNKLKGYDYEYNNELKFDGKWITLDELSKVPGRSMSKVKISPKGVYSFSGKTVNFVKPGHPYILVSDDIMLRDAQLEEYYYKQLEDESIEKKVKLIYVVPPKAPIKGYFDNLLNIVSGNKNFIKRIGNDFTAYRIVNILSSQPEFENSDLNYNNTAYPGIMKIIGRLNAVEGDTKAQMEILNEEVDIKGLNKGITARLALQNYLLSMVYPPNADNTNRVFKEANLSSIEKILEQNKITGIFYNIQYDKNSSSTITLDAVYDNGSYTIDNIPFMVNGKIESPAFYGDVSPILKSIVDKITENGSFLGSRDNARYLAGNSRIGGEIVPTTESILKGMNIITSKSVQSEPEFDVKAISNLPKDQIIDLLKKTNHLVIPIGGTVYVSKKSNNLDVTNAVISDISNISLNSHKFTLTLGNETYNGELDLFQNEATLTKVASANTGTPLTQFAVTSIKEIAMYREILDIFKFISLNKVKNARGIEEFNTAVNSLRVTPKILNEMRAEVDNFEGEQQTLLKNLVDFLQSKIDEKARLNTTDNSCPIQIKIKF